MKKILVWLLLMVYGSATMGTTVHFHYCMNKMVGWSLVDNNDHQCHTCGMEKKGGCCKDSKAAIKIAADQQKAGSYQNENAVSNSLVAIPLVSEILGQPISAVQIHPIKYFSPPLLEFRSKPEWLSVFRV